MPEGDTLYNAAAAIRPLLVGRTLESAYERGLARRALAGGVVRSVEARGKHLLIEVEGGATIHVHLGMNGRIRTVDRGPSCVPAGTVGGLRTASLALVTRDCILLVRDAPVVEILRSAFVHAHPVLARLGPDLLAERIDLEAIVARARACEPARARHTAADLLLDQRIACGIGNVYKCETLFLEQVDPFALARDLDDDTILRLYARARDLLRANRGPGPRVTTADRSRGRLPPRGRGRFWVYDRRGRACYACGTPIAACLAGDGARTTFYCPRCQGVRGH